MRLGAEPSAMFVAAAALVLTPLPLFWRVYVWRQARDVVYLGGDSAGLSATAMAMPFTFGCQTHETGLFRSQLEDGIMGLAMLDPSIIFGLSVRTRTLATSARAYIPGMMTIVFPDIRQASMCLTLHSWSFTCLCLQKAGKIQENVFSLCLTPSGGSFTVGGYDVSQHHGPIEYVELVHDEGFYTVKLVDVRIGNTSLGLPPDVVSASGCGTRGVERVL